MARKSRMVELIKKSNKKSTFILQLTSMVDMFTIILVFLLKSFSTSAVQVDPADGLMLPSSFSVKDPIEALKLVVSPKGVYIGSEKIIDLKDGTIAAEHLDKNDDRFVRPLFKRLDEEAKKSQEIAEKNDTVKFDGSVLMQADNQLDYRLLNKIMYTSTLAGYAEFKLATIGSQ